MGRRDIWVVKRATRKGPFIVFGFGHCFRRCSFRRRANELVATSLLRASAAPEARDCCVVARRVFFDRGGPPKTEEESLSETSA